MSALFGVGRDVSDLLDEIRLLAHEVRQVKKNLLQVFQKAKDDGVPSEEKKESLKPAAESLRTALLGATRRFGSVLALTIPLVFKVGTFVMEVASVGALAMFFTYMEKNGVNLRGGKTVPS